MNNKIAQFAIVLIILAVPQIARAQVFTNPIYNPYINPIGNLGIQSQIDERNRIQNAGKTPSNNSSAPVKQVSSKLLAYKPSTAIRQANLKRFVEKTRQADPASAVQMEQLFAANDVIDQIDRGMTTVGLKPNNIADAYAIYSVSAWLGARGRNENLPKSQMIAVRNQVASAFLKVPALTSATDIQKQEMAETMLLQAAWIAASIDSAKSDLVLLDKLKISIAQGAKGMGLDLDRMTLTSQGFQFTK